MQQRKSSSSHLGVRAHPKILPPPLPPQDFRQKKHFRKTDCFDKERAREKTRFSVQKKHQTKRHKKHVLNDRPDFVAGAARSQSQVHISWQAQHFRKAKYRFCGRGSIFERSSTDFVAGAALSQGQVQNLWQVQHFRKVKCKIRGTRSTFARSSTDFVAGAALCKVRRGWRENRLIDR